MAADQYYDSSAGNPYATDTSNGTTDWWTQNAPPPPPPVTGNQWAAATPQSNGVTPQFIPTGTPPTPVTNAAGQVWGGGGPNGAFDVTGKPMTFNTAAPAQQQANPSAPSFGGPVDPFQYNPVGSGYPTFTPPPLPDYLQKGFQLPSAADLQNTPGYMARYQQGLDALQRSAAANGTVLNGGTQKATTRYGQDYASNEYNNLVNQNLSARQQQASDYLNLAYGPAWQSNQAAVNQYGQLYNQYKDLTGANRTAQNDYWQQQMDLLNAGLGAAKAGTPGTSGATGG